MAVNRSFRAALNGFNRTDVANYIEESSINHEKELRQLQDENTRLRAELDTLRTEKSEAEARAAKAEAEAAEIEEELAVETSAAPAPQAKPVTAPAKVSVPEPAEAPAEEAEAPDEEAQASDEEKAVLSEQASSELAAYRRAEAVERNARFRAGRLCRQVNDIVENTTRQLDDSDSDLQALMTDLNVCLRRLNDTFADLRLTFDNTATAFSTIDELNVEDEEL